MRSKFQSCEPLEPRRLMATIYVDVDAPGAENGTTWLNAFDTIDEAFNAAVAGDVVRVAAGVYKPEPSKVLKTGVQVLGGFAGFGAADPNARNFEANITTLSGDIGVIGSIGDNRANILSAGTGVNATAVLEGFTIRDAYSSSLSSGGGLYVTGNATPTIRDCRFESNRVSRGGSAFYADIGGASFERCLFLANEALRGMGTAHIRSTGFGSFVDCEFRDNYAGGVSSDQGRGGAVYSDRGAVSFLRCKFLNNYAQVSGGAVHLVGPAIPTFTDCLFNRNSAIVGGAIRGENSASATITRCQFNANETRSGSSSDGGAIATFGSSFTITNSVFTANSARFGSGGACAFSGGSSKLVQCIFSGNNAFSAAALQASAISIANCTFVANVGSLNITDATTINLTGPSATMTNSIVWNNQSGIVVAAVAPSQINYNNIQGGFTGGTGNINLAPVFVDPAGQDGVNGTEDDDLRLRPNSPGVDAADNTTPLLAGISTDLAGATRFLDVAGIPDTGVGAAPLIDMGAYEAVGGVTADAFGTYRVKAGQTLALKSFGYSDEPGALAYEWDLDNDGDFDDSTEQNPLFSAAAFSSAAHLTARVRVTDAIGQSATDSTLIKVIPQTIYVDDSASAGLQEGSTWANAYTSLREALLDALAGCEIRVGQGTYLPTSNSDPMLSFVLRSGVSVLGGFAGTGAIDPDARNINSFSSVLSGEIGRPGTRLDNSYHVVVGVDLAAGTLFEGFTITGGNATWNESYGGGMALTRGTPTIKNCIFLRNFGARGGGLFAAGSNATFIDCAFRGNYAGYGGAVYHTSAIPIHIISTLTIVNSELSGNTAVGEGTALITDGDFSANLRIKNCTIVGSVDSNSSVPSPAVCRFSGQTGNPIRLENTIVFGSTMTFPGTAFDVGGGMSANNCVIGIAGSITGSNNLIGTNPLVTRMPSPGADAVYGTADDDYGDLRITMTSPAIDRGSNPFVPAGVVTDFGGNARFVNVPGVQNAAGVAVDIGAHEVAAALTAAAPAYLFDLPTPTIRLTFSANLDPLTLQASDLQLLNRDTNQPVDMTTATVLYVGSTFAADFRFSPSLPDGNYSATLPVGAVSDAGSSALSADATADFFVFAGDANRDRTVNINDFSILASRFNLPGVFSQGDFNYDGVTNIGDFAILASKFNTSLPAARAASLDRGLPATSKPFAELGRLALDELQ